MSTFQNWGGEEEETEEFDEKKGGREFLNGAFSSATPVQTFGIIVLVAVIILIAWFMDDTTTRGIITTVLCGVIYGLMFFRHRMLMSKYGLQINADKDWY